MRTIRLILLTLLVGGCMQPTTTPDQLFSNAAYSGNVSSLYAVSAPTLGATPTNFKWRDSVGKVHSLSELKGKSVLLNFWATWCGNCLNEMPALQDIQENSNGTVVVIGVSTDITGNPFATVCDFARAHKIQYQLVVDSMMSLETNYLFAANGTTATPETFVIGKDGTIKYLLQGGQTKEEFLSFINKAN